MVKRIILVLVLALSFVQAADFYVSPVGDNTDDGTAWAPFATLDRARDAVREAADEESRTVIFLPGHYRLTETVAFDERDRGSEKAPIIFKAYRPGTVFFDGGEEIDNAFWEKVTDEEILARLPEDAADKIMQVNLRMLAIREYGELGPRGFGRSYNNGPLELFVDNEPMQIARYPNEGFIHIPKIIDPGSNPRKGDYSMRGGVFEAGTDRIKRWGNATDMYITGIFAVGFADDTIKVAEVDTEAGTITSALPHLYSFGGDKKYPKLYEYAVLNLIEEIDQPGEYAIDREGGILYFYPKTDVYNSKFQVSMLEDPMLAIEDANFVRFENIIFENARGMAVYMEAGNGNVFAGCTFRNLGLLAIQMGHGASLLPEGRHNGNDVDIPWMEWKPVSRLPGTIHAYSYVNTAWNRNAGTNHRIIGCDIYNIGAGGIILGGGDRKTLTPGNNEVKNCDIYQVNRWDKVYKAPIDLFGVGNKVTHNYMHHCAGQAVFMHGNDHVIEYNEMGFVVQEASDQAAIYMGRDPSECGSSIRYNYFHDIVNSHAEGQGVQAIYFDDMSTHGASIFGNVFVRTGDYGVIRFNGGGECPIVNNVVVDCDCRFIRGNGRGNTRRVRGLMKSEMGQTRLLEAVDILDPPYSVKYPVIAAIYNKERNVQHIEHTNFEVGKDYSQFVDPANGDFTLKPDSAAFDIEGFEPIPFNFIGLYQDKWRRSLPLQKSKPAITIQKLTPALLIPPIMN